MAFVNAKSVSDYLQSHCSSKNTAIKGEDLVRAIAGYSSVGMVRSLSDVVRDLRMRGFPVASGDSGYWWGTETQSMADTIALLYGRAMTALKQITKMRRIAIPDIEGQMRLPVGSEPSLDGLYHKFRNFKTGRNSLLVDIPVELHQDALSFLDSHPDWDQERLFTAALCLFLLQQGVKSPVAAELYVESVGEI